MSAEPKAVRPCWHLDTLGGQDLVLHQRINLCQPESNKCILLLRFLEFPLLEAALSKSNKYYDN